MLRYRLNLATSPFVNYRKYYLLGILLMVLGVGGAVFFVKDYVTLHRENSSLLQDFSAKENELSVITAQESQLKTQLEQTETLDEIDRIAYYNALIQRKTFPWTQFFKDLEAVIPYNIQVTQIRQKSVGKSIDLEMVFLGRTTGDAIQFLRNLGNSKKFSQIFVSQEGTFREAATHRVSNEVEVVLHMQYEP
jgi:Tfp pilus assembly protein PilN